MGHGRNPNGPGVDLEYLKFAEFRKENPPSFRGTFDPNKAKEWIKAMVKVYLVLACTDFPTGGIYYLYVKSGCRILVEWCEKTARGFPDGHHLGCV